MAMFSICCPLDDCHFEQKDLPPINNHLTSLSLVHRRKKKLEYVDSDLFRIFKIPKEFEKLMYAYV
ncbi:hypothetical protein [Pseudoalteromonas luteoviolacea]|uniref:hypothetical protein n=1 Tax=Pseudoalteromonas luteoviolacea TaxID=43657 RepID=UPI001B381AEB|nr:hypothetical protein [Pseudoalteromonas luteoviolacea]MBQ4834848.1 hypothetical protein [Pseudoalteromonas luteoviolacea]